MIDRDPLNVNVMHESAEKVVHMIQMQLSTGNQCYFSVTVFIYHYHFY